MTQDDLERMRASVRHIPPDIRFIGPTGLRSEVLHRSAAIQQERKWGIKPWNDGWIVTDANGVNLWVDSRWFTGPDPHTPLIEAAAYFDAKEGR